MEKKSNKKLIIILLSIIIFLVGIFCILLATGTISFNLNKISDNDTNENVDDKNNGNNNDIENNDEVEIDYSAYNGTWLDAENEISISVTDTSLTFSWGLHRITTIDEITIPFSNGKGIFYFTDYNEYTRKATIELVDNVVNVIVEDVSAVDTNYIVLDEIPGGVYIEPGTYNYYSIKDDIEQNINDEINVEISMDNVTVSKDAEHGNIFITGTINLSYDNNKYQGVGLSGYCLGAENEKYLITGPTDGRALFHNDENKNLVLSERIPSRIEYPDGKTKDTTEVNWENVKIKYCKIDKMKAVLISDYYLYTETILNVEKNFN